MDHSRVTKNIYRFEKLKVFFKHTDYNGFVHPYNFYEWTSYVREAFFSEECVNFRETLESLIKMMTAKIELNMFDDGIFGDEIEAQFTVTRIKKVSFDAIVRFVNKRLKVVAAKTQHTLVFVDSETGRFTAIPENIKNAILGFQE